MNKKSPHNREMAGASLCEVEFLWKPGGWVQGAVIFAQDSPEAFRIDLMPFDGNCSLSFFPGLGQSTLSAESNINVSLPGHEADDFCHGR